MFSGTFTLRNVSVPASALGRVDGSVARHDITVTDGIITAIGPATTGTGDLGGRLVLPSFTDIHTHLDKGHIWPRKENPDGTWTGALQAVLSDRTGRWVADDVTRRMDFSLRCAWAHGTAAIRTHLDSNPPQHDISFAVFEEMRSRWAGRIELQAVALFGPDVMLDPAALNAVAARAKAAGGLLGGSLAVFDHSKQAMLALVETAGNHGLDLDLHTDETGDPGAHALRHLAEAVLETGYTGRVMAGHCCVLTVQDADTVARTIDTAARAGIAVVSLPMCNIYLQDRAPGRTPIRRGATLLQEMKAAGMTVAVASDNTRDPFYAYGDLDGLEVLRESVRILHLDHPQHMAWDWLRAITSAPADHGGFAHTGTLRVGGPADMIVTRARSWTELMSRPQTDRVVIRAGQQIDTTPPDYAELDDLMGAGAPE